MYCSQSTDWRGKVWKWEWAKGERLVKFCPAPSSQPTVTRAAIYGEESIYSFPNRKFTDHVTFFPNTPSLMWLVHHKESESIIVVCSTLILELWGFEYWLISSMSCSIEVGHAQTRLKKEKLTKTKYELIRKLLKWNCLWCFYGYPSQTFTWIKIFLIYKLKHPWQFWGREYWKEGGSLSQVTDSYRNFTMF